jgi:hypothetical protein
MSDLLNQASLVMVPSGYKEDTVYSVVPTDGSGDLSFTRASNGTRVNSAGLVEDVAWNLLTYSEDLSNAIWTKEPGNSITTNSTTAPNGTTTADTITATAGNELNTYQFANTNAGVFTYSVYVKKNATNLISTYIYQSSVGFKARGEINFDNGTFTTSLGTGAIESVGNGWYRVFLTTTLITAQHSFGFYTDSVTGTRSVYAWGAQSNIGSTAKPYFPTTDRLNVPRLTYQNGGGGCPSLLLEKQSTNLVVQSNDMTTWANGGGTMTKNATTSPDGTNNALSFDNTADCSTFAGASNGVYSWSVYVKQGTSPTASIDMSDGATGDVITTFTFATKTFSGTSAGGSWTSPSTSYIECGNGWFRITLIATKNAGSSIGHKIIASGSGYTYVYGAQLEASSYVTSYIQSTSSSATRVADACFKTGISSLIGQTEGTMFVDVTEEAKNDGRYMFVSDASFTNRIVIYQASGAINVYCSAGVSFNISYSPPAGRVKIAFVYKSNDYALWVNGVERTAVTTVSAVPTGLNATGIGSNEGSIGTAEPLDAGVNQAILFKTRLTNAELASLTTI